MCMNGLCNKENNLQVLMVITQLLSQWLVVFLRQVSILGPLSFLLHISDFPKTFKVFINSDDALFYFSSKNLSHLEKTHI